MSTPRYLDDSAPVLFGCPLDDDAQTRETAAMVVRMMEMQGISCGNRGGHGSAGMPRHHHHDLGCLVEAGADQPLRDLKKSRDEVRRLKRHNENHHEEIGGLRERNLALTKMLAGQVRFMEVTPDPSTEHRSVMDAYNATQGKRLKSFFDYQSHLEHQMRTTIRHNRVTP